MTRLMGGLLAAFLSLPAQEADKGFEINATLSAQGVFSHRLSAPPRSGGALTGGARAVFYPTWRLSRNWTASGAVQLYTRPYFFEQFATQGYGLKADVLQAHVSYSRFFPAGAFTLRAGQLSSAFGSFLLGYDDAANPLIDMPMAYGYYYKPVSSLGLTGVQADASLGRFDTRAQFTTSSPANRRGILDDDRYANWAGGIGYTVWQGFRVGASAYRGPYLHRKFAYFFPGEANPVDLPATAAGTDIQWARGHWNVSMEYQRFLMPYRAIPDRREQFGYGEVRRVVSPRWYLAARVSALHSNRTPGRQAYDFVIGYRPGAHQLLKVGYQIQQRPLIRGTLGNTLAVQLVFQVRALTVSAP